MVPSCSVCTTREHNFSKTILLFLREHGHLNSLGHKKSKVCALLDEVLEQLKPFLCNIIEPFFEIALGQDIVSFYLKVQSNLYQSIFLEGY